MSGGRYGFSEDFQIVDRTSGQPRSPKTLSGGETFQASLALALGLVELAGRSGGRLSSLFLDEGFGTLDANALDEALEELERRAAAGRVIGVISHLRSVADRIEHVLRVDKELSRHPGALGRRCGSGGGNARRPHAHRRIDLVKGGRSLGRHASGATKRERRRSSMRPRRRS